MGENKEIKIKIPGYTHFGLKLKYALFTSFLSSDKHGHQKSNCLFALLLYSYTTAYTRDLSPEYLQDNIPTHARWNINEGNRRKTIPPPPHRPRKRYSPVSSVREIHQTLEKRSAVLLRDNSAEVPVLQKG